MCSMTHHPREEKSSPLDHTKWTQVRYGSGTPISKGTYNIMYLSLLQAPEGEGLFGG